MDMNSMLLSDTEAASPPPPGADPPSEHPASPPSATPLPGPAPSLPFDIAALLKNVASVSSAAPAPFPSPAVPPLPSASSALPKPLSSLEDGQLDDSPNRSPQTSTPKQPNTQTTASPIQDHPPAQIPPTPTPAPITPAPSLAKLLPTPLLPDEQPPLSSSSSTTTSPFVSQVTMLPAPLHHNPNPHHAHIHPKPPVSRRSSSSPMEAATLLTSVAVGSHMVVDKHDVSSPLVTPSTNLPPALPITVNITNNNKPAPPERNLSRSSSSYEVDSRQQPQLKQQHQHHQHHGPPPQQQQHASNAFNSPIATTTQQQQHQHTQKFAQRHRNGGGGALQQQQGGGQQQPQPHHGSVRKQSVGPGGGGPLTVQNGNGKRPVEEVFMGLTAGAKTMKVALIKGMQYDPVKSDILSTAAISKHPTKPGFATPLGTDPMDLTSSLFMDPSAALKPKPLLYSATAQPPEWKFKMHLPPDMTLPTSNSSTTTDPSFVTFSSVRIERRPGYPTFLLESEYTLKSLLPRSYFNLLHAHNVQHQFVFQFTNPEHVLFKEMYGLRKTAYFTIKEAGSTEEWEFHLKPSRERTNFFGYLIRAADLRAFIQQRVTMMVASRKLPLVLDLDDTLVRMIGNEEGRYVPSQLAKLVPNRVRTLKDGRQIVLTERVEEFLQWAQNLFEISVCSVGDQPYVDAVIMALDPARNIIRGAGYSARGEFMHIQGTSMPRRPPKDLDSLFLFQKSGGGAGKVGEGGGVSGAVGGGVFLGPFVDPIVIDDNVGMWPTDQQDNIIVVREQKNARIWNVRLFPHVQTVLQHIHGEFFKQMDAWDHKNASPANLGPSSRQIYKEYLRTELSRKIGDPGSGGGGAFGGGAGFGGSQNGSGAAAVVAPPAPVVPVAADTGVVVGGGGGFGNGANVPAIPQIDLVMAAMEQVGIPTGVLTLPSDNEEV
ncbi:hypothetical protein HDU98_002775 [Podochytrium sp. JEL0797]|nr:hypothetical protein HDU98_002775 [Podochytrium sp. JEL0797]